MEKPQLRKGARGIVIREDGKIAIFNKANKHEYKLPGGGIEENENPEDAFYYDPKTNEKKRKMPCWDNNTWVYFDSMRLCVAG